MGKRNHLVYKQQRALETYLTQSGVLSKGEDGYAKYALGFTDESLAPLAASELGFPVTATNIATMRRTLYGDLRAHRFTGSPKSARNDALLAKVDTLEELLRGLAIRVATLEKEVTG